MSLVEIWGFPGYWTFRVTRATVVHPAGRTVPSPIYGDGPAAFGRTESPRHPGFNHLSKPQSRGPRACGPTLRRTVLPRPAQGLTTHLSGSTLVRWDFHPLEGIPNFRSSYTSFHPFGPALPGRTLYYDEDFPGRHRCVSAHRFKEFKLTGHLAAMATTGKQHKMPIFGQDADRSRRNSK